MNRTGGIIGIIPGMLGFIAANKPNLKKTLLMVSPLVFSVVVTQSQGADLGTELDTQLKVFADKISDLKEWQLENGESKLDMLIFSSKKTDPWRRSLNGKMQLIGSNPLPVHINDAQIKLSAFKFSKASSLSQADSEKRKELIKHAHFLAQGAVRSMHGPCEMYLYTEFGNDEGGESTCTGDATDMLTSLVDFEVKACPDKKNTACQVIAGKNVALSPMPDTTSSTRRKVLLSSLERDINGSLAKGEFQILDQQGNAIPKISFIEVGNAANARLIFAPRLAKSEDYPESDFKPLGSVRARDIFTSQVTIQMEKYSKETGRAASEETIKKASLKSLDSIPDGITAIQVGNDLKQKVCTISTGEKANENGDKYRTAFLYAPAFQKWRNAKSAEKYDLTRPNITELFSALQVGACNIAVESTANIKALVKGLQRDGISFKVMPEPLRPDQLEEAYAQSKGFKGTADLVLAQQMNLNSARALENYRAAGLTDKVKFDAALARMRSVNYSDQPAALLVFLDDEKEAQKRKMTVVAYKDERIKQESRIAKENAQARELEHLKAEATFGVLKKYGVIPPGSELRSR